jgi:hypothetical protein
MVGTIEAQAAQYLIILAIVVGMTTISQIFRHFFGMAPEQSMQMQQRLRELQDEMRAAQNDPETLMRVQQEAMDTYKTTMRKQLIPSCVSSLLFLGIFYIIRWLFKDYYFFGNESITFFIPYLVFSLSLGGIIFLVRYLIKRNKRKKGTLPDENYDPSLDRGLQTGLRFGHGWNAHLSPELQKMKSDLEKRKARGELPDDINIDQEIEQISEDEKEEDSRDWKKRLDS